MRPREIQARIRSGNSVAEVAVAANTSVGRIERYAYPVLLERSTTAEKARQSHPMIDGNPTRKTLDELVMSTLAQRGQDSAVQWDAYRDEDGWVVSLRWQAGRSENHAHWELPRGSRTNTLHPKDDAARDLIDPAPRSLRTIADPESADIARGVAEVAQVVNGPERDHEPKFTLGGDQPSSGRPPMPTGSRHPAGTRQAISDRLGQEQTAEQTALNDRSGVRPRPQDKPESARTGTDSSTGRGHRKGQRPVMPGWEDVLLGGGPTPKL